MQKILIFSCVGDSTENYFKFIKNAKKQKDYVVDTAIIYYGNDDKKSKALESSVSFFWRKKTTVFLGFLEIFDELPEYDYYLIVDDDIVFEVADLVSAVKILSKYSVHGGSFAQSPQGKISWPILRYDPSAPSYEIINWFEENFAIISHKLIKILVTKARELNLKHVTGWTFILANCALHSNLGNFLLFQRFVMRNPRDHEKKGRVREIYSAAYSKDKEAFHSRMDALRKMIRENNDFFLIHKEKKSLGLRQVPVSKSAIQPDNRLYELIQEQKGRKV